MSDKEVRLECLRIASGDLAKAKELYAFVTEQTETPIVVPTSWTVGSGGYSRPATAATTTWIYNTEDGTWKS